MTDITLDKIRNGTLWESETKTQFLIQWIDTDIFVLLSGPHKARHGGYCFISYKDPQHGVLLSAENIKDILTRCRAQEVDRTICCVIR